MADEHAAPHANYFMIFIALCILTLLSVVADVVHIESKLAVIVIVLAIATAKALFVMVYFMHLKFEGRWKYLLLAPTVVLALGLPLALYPDVGVHYYTTIDRPAPIEAHGESHGSHDDEASAESHGDH